MSGSHFLSYALASLAFAVSGHMDVVAVAETQDESLVRKTLSEKGFSESWIDSLTSDFGPRWYVGEELKYIGLPVGGLYAGQVYLGGDGRLWYWDIFNQSVIDPGGPGDKFYNKPMLPDEYRGVSSGFIVEVDGQARMLDARGFERVRFRGEYPIGRVALADEASPVEVDLEAFSPFSPTASDLSSLPAVVMSYTLTNTSNQSTAIRVGGWLENAGNRQTIHGGRMETHASMIDGAAGVLLSAKGSTAKGTGRADLPIQDFEDGYGAWTRTGEAFGNEPFAHAGRAEWQPIAGSLGKRLANSHNTRVAGSSVGADRLTGTLTSPSFVVQRNFLSFTVAGGSYEGTNVAGGEVDGATAVQVLIDGNVVATATGRNSNQHVVTHVALREHQGKLATIRIIDTRAGSWGHIQADGFIQTDSPRQVDTIQADTGTMALALLGREGGVVPTDELPTTWLDELDRVADRPPPHSGVVRSEAITLLPGESAEVRFAIAWHFVNGHLGSLFPGEITRRNEQRHYYAKSFDGAGEVVRFLVDRHEELTALTRLWRDTWYDSSLPSWFLDRTFVNASTLATTAAFRTHDSERSDLDGRVYFWEGVYLGPGTCTHVTHYEQAFGRLFPDAARAQRAVTDFNAGWDDRLGYVRYRAEWGIGHHFGIPHAIDGHAGTILRTYREHTTSSDDAFLESVWPSVKRATRFMIDQDAGRGFFADKAPREDKNTEPDGVLSGPQYNTLDKVWDGTIPWISGLYMASLRAASEMAQDMGDDGFADECSRIVSVGGAKLAALTFDEEYGYFVQRPGRQDEYVNSNNGCHLDQVFGDAWLGQVGLEEVLSADLRRSALEKILEHNLYRRVGDYREDAVIPISRYYADADEPGLIVCPFPHGGAERSAPSGGNDWDALVVGYFSECWTGPDYLVAAQMFDLGMPTAALAVARAAHDRYAEAPLRRNPFNEVEYGNHYTRAMSSYAAFVAACGFEHHGPKGHIGFAPKLKAEDFRCAFTTGKGWGTFSQERDDDGQSERIKLLYGDLTLKTLSFEGVAAAVEVALNGKPVDATLQREGKRLLVSLTLPVKLTVGDLLHIRLNES